MKTCKDTHGRKDEAKKQITKWCMKKEGGERKKL